MTVITHRSALPSPWGARRGWASSPRRSRRAARTTTATTTRSGTGGAATDDYQVKLGYFPNLTHASAIVGVQKGYFKDELARRTARPSRPSSSTAAATRSTRCSAARSTPPTSAPARPSPRTRSRTAASGSSAARPLAAPRSSSTTTSSRPRTSRARRIATPGLANTQDVALKYWLKEQGYNVDPDGTGDVTVAQPGQQPHGPDASRPATSTVRGSLSRTPRSWSRRAAPGPRRRGGPVAEGGKFVDHAADRARPTSSTTTRTWSTTCSRPRSRPTTTSHDNSDDAKQVVGDFIADVTADADPGRCPRLGVGASSPSPMTPSRTRSSRARTTRWTSACIEDTDLADSSTSTRSTSCSPTPVSRKCQDHRRDDHIARGCGPRSHRLRAPAIRIKGVSKTFGRGASSPWPSKRLTSTLQSGSFSASSEPAAAARARCSTSSQISTSRAPARIETGGRKVAFMFQEATLFPWLTAGQNVDLALKLRGMPKAERKDRVEELLDLVHLGGRQHKRPHELSGGMRQRTQLARVLAQEAEIVLMDEPFAALDAMTRDSMHDEIERIQRRARPDHRLRHAQRPRGRPSVRPHGAVLQLAGPGEDRVSRSTSRVLAASTIPASPSSSGQLTDELKAEVAQHVR